MTNAEKVIKIATENNGYITTKQVKDVNINTIAKRINITTFIFLLKNTLNTLFQ